MNYSSEELKSLAARAAGLFERLEGAARPIPGKNQAQKRGRLRRWREAVTGDADAPLFRRRLALSNLTEKKALPYLGKVALDGRLPAWAEMLYQVLQKKAAPVGASPKPFPFEELLEPFVAFAREKIAPARRKTAVFLPRRAWRGLEQNLLARLSSQASLSLWSRFREFLAASDPLYAVRGEPEKSKPARRLYKKFVEKMAGGGLLEFFSAYPALARVLVTVTRQWIETTQEFCSRLAKDRLKLGGGGLAEISPSLSDPHHGGRTVLKLTFSSGRKWIYKPKNLDMEKGFYSLIGRLNRAGLTPPLAARRVIPRKNYGWIEYVEHRPCKNEKEVRLYYRRAGTLLGLIHLLDGTDAHFENLVAGGPHPVLIDAETLLHPRLVPWGEKKGAESADFLADNALQESLLRTGMLPVWIAGREGKFYDAGGLSAAAPMNTGFKAPAWKNVNTDRMRIEYADSVIAPSENLPKLFGRKVAAEKYAGEIAEGFESFYRFALKRRRAFLKKGGPLSAFAGGSVRYVYRPTYVYALMQQKLMHPELMKDGADRSIELEMLARNMALSRNREGTAAMLAAYEAERRALEQLDIPCFFARCDSTSLFCDGKTVAKRFFRQTGIEQVRRRFRLMSEKDLLFQLSILRAALVLRYAAEEGAPATGAGPGHSAREKPLAAKEFIKEAEAIADRLEREAIRSRDGGVSWVTVGFEPTTEKLILTACGNALYDGRAGAALFFAALGRKKFARGLLQPLREGLRTRAQRRALLRRRGIGLADGAGGVLYSFAAAGKLTGDPSLLKDGFRLIEDIREEDLRRDAVYDAVGGAAGLILGLLPYIRQKGKGRRALMLARAAADHLLKNRTKSPTGERVWGSPQATQPLTGFSHGAAGFACALGLLYGAGGEKKYLDAAREAIAYERRVYSTKEKNWPDFRAILLKPGKPPSCANKWCHGAPGIGLARLRGMPVLDDAKTRAEMDIAAASARDRGPWHFDHPCCGIFGKIELLIEGAKQLNRSDWLEAARRQASWAVRRTRRDGAYRLFAQAGPAIQSPSFFQGLSGIGYQLLRLADPEKYPSILSFE